MIRQATKYDKTSIIELLKEFRAESPMQEIHGDNDETYIRRLLDNILAGQGACFIEDGVGLLLCVVIPTVWNDKVFALHELAWYVRPQCRKGTVGYRLFKAYIDYGKSLKAENRIKYFTISKLVTTPNFNYAKYGFSKTDENWIQ